MLLIAIALISQNINMNINAATPGNLTEITFENNETSESTQLHFNIKTIRSNDYYFYTYEVNDMVFSSDISKDDVWHKAMKWQYDQGLKTIEEIEYEYGLYTSQLISKSQKMGLVAPASNINETDYGISGHLEWQPSPSANYISLKNMKVELWYVHNDANNPLQIAKLEEGYTDEYGNYSFTNASSWWDKLEILNGIYDIENGVNICIRIYPESETFKVSNDWSSIINFTGQALLNWQIVDGWLDSLLSYNIVSDMMLLPYLGNSGSFGNIQIPYGIPLDDTNGLSDANILYRSFMVAQGLVMGQSFINEQGFFPTQKVYVAYPAFLGTFDNNAFCYTDYSMGTGLMCIGAKSDLLETLLHEYGHFVQGSMDLFPFCWVDYAVYYSLSSWNGSNFGVNPSHFDYVDHINTPGSGKGKNIGSKFAWSEGWAQAFSYIVQDHYWMNYYENNQSLVESGIELVQELTINSDIRRLWMMEECLPEYKHIANRLYKTIDNNSSEGQELAITTFLTNLYFEQYFGASEFWTSSTYGIHTSSAIYTFQGYSAYLTDNYTENTQDIYQIMEECQLSPGGLMISNYDTHTPPILEWYINGGQYSPLDIVKIAFYDSNGQNLYVTNYIVVSAPYNTLYSYQIELEDWQQALTIIGDSPNMIIEILGYNSLTYLSGPYRSKYVEIETPYFFTFRLINSDNEYVVTGITNFENWNVIIFPETYLLKEVVITPVNLAIDSIQNEKQTYLIQINDSYKYMFYNNCTNTIDFKLIDEYDNVIIQDSVWGDVPIPLMLEQDIIYRIEIMTTNDEYFLFSANKVNEIELDIGIKYYETQDSYTCAYYIFTTPDYTSDLSYTINSIIVGARTNLYLYDTNNDLITYSLGDYNHNGGKIDYLLSPNTTYIVILYLTSYEYFDDYTIQFYETNEEVFHLNWNGVSKQYFDPLVYDFITFTVLSSCYDLVFNESTKTITFGRIECFWDVTFTAYPDCPEEYIIGMVIGTTFDSMSNTLPFFSMNGYYNHQASQPITYSYSATVTNIEITFSDSEWLNFVTEGPRI